MLVCDDHNNTILIDSIHDPIVTSHIWALDLVNMDFTLAPLDVLEEIVCTSIELSIEGFRFTVPSHWYILMYDRETTQLDSICVGEAAGREFTAFVYGPTRTVPDAGYVSVTDYFASHVNTVPALPKTHMVCHPISPDSFVCLSPSDIFNKYLKGKDVSDIIG